MHRQKRLTHEDVIAGPSQPRRCRRRHDRRLGLARLRSAADRSRRRRQDQRRQDRRSACSTTSPASTPTCPDRTRSMACRWPSTTQEEVRRQGRRRRASRSSSADHQNKPEIANTKAQEMYDRKGSTRSSTCRPPPRPSRWPTQAKEKKRLYFNVGAGHHRPDRRAVQQLHVRMGLRHLHAGERHRHEVPAGRQELVSSSTPTTRSARTWRSVHRGRRGGRRQGRGQGRVAVPERQLLDVPASRRRPTRSRRCWARCTPVVTWSTWSSSTTSSSSRTRASSWRSA